MHLSSVGGNIGISSADGKKTLSDSLGNDDGKLVASVMTDKAISGNGSYLHMSKDSKPSGVSGNHATLEAIGSTGHTGGSGEE